MDELQRLRDAVEKSHRRTDAVETRLAVLEAQHADVRADVKEIGQQQSEHSRTLERIGAQIEHIGAGMDDLKQSLSKLPQQVKASLGKPGAAVMTGAGGGILGGLSLLAWVIYQLVTR